MLDLEIDLYRSVRSGGMKQENEETLYNILKVKKAKTTCDPAKNKQTNK